MKNYHAVSIMVIAAAVAALASCDLRAAEPSASEIIEQFDCAGTAVTFDSNVSLVADGKVHPFRDTRLVTDHAQQLRASSFGDGADRVVFIVDTSKKEYWFGDATMTAPVSCQPVKWTQLETVK